MRRAVLLLIHGCVSSQLPNFNLYFFLLLLLWVAVSHSSSCSGGWRSYIGCWRIGRYESRSCGERLTAVSALLHVCCTWWTGEPRYSDWAKLTRTPFKIPFIIIYCIDSLNISLFNHKTCSCIQTCAMCKTIFILACLYLSLDRHSLECTAMSKEKKKKLTLFNYLLMDLGLKAECWFVEITPWWVTQVSSKLRGWSFPFPADCSFPIEKVKLAVAF